MTLITDLIADRSRKKQNLYLAGRCKVAKTGSLESYILSLVSIRHAISDTLSLKTQFLDLACRGNHLSSIISHQS
jgi:hypothetical protein